MLNLSKKILLNQFIAKIGVFYDNKTESYNTQHGEKINNINNYIISSFKKVFNRIPSQSEIAYIQDWLYVPFDFEEIPYKTYLKIIVDKQIPKEIRNLKDNYDYYLESIQNNQKTKQCIYISGKSGEGKTTYAKILANKYFSEDEIYITSGGSNPFDEYYGQKCIIIDDFRDSVIAYNDLLRLLDNNTSSSVGARYHNKSLARCELIILTSVKTPLELYKGIEEERYQLYRRINYFKVSELKYLEYFEYNKNRELYELKNNKDVSKEIEKHFNNNQNENIIKINDIFEENVVQINDDDLPF